MSAVDVISTAAAARDERGLTLVELLISITISGLLVGALASAAIIFFQHASDNDKAYEDQSSVTLVQSAFVADAQSATAVTTNDASPCGSASVALVSFGRSDAGVDVKSSWFVETKAGRTALVRRSCVNNQAVEFADIAGVRPTPAVACAPSCANPSTVSINGTTTNGLVFSAAGTRRASAS